MQVIVPFAKSASMLPAVRLALLQDGIEADFRLMEQDNSYFLLMEQLWQEKESFILVEHDIIPWPGAVQQLESCPEPWCTLPYYCSVGWIEDGLGCTKFDSQLMEQYPSFFSEPFPACCAHDQFYCGLDRLIAHRCQEIEIRPHVHQPGVTNLNQRWTI